MSYEFTGYHGTALNCCSTIQSESFIESKNDDDWLGYGVYFFIEGIGQPEVHAKEWAINQSFEGKGKPRKYSTYGVLKAQVKASKILNTTNNDGLNAFNTVRNELIKLHSRDFKRDRNKFEDNRVMWELVAEMMELEIVIHNLYIKDYVQRRLSIASLVPNTTVMCVKDASLIDKKSISVVSQGRIK
jgi:hypothetical protein